MSALLLDLTFVLRALKQRPTYALVTVLVLALAIGANATVFSVFHGLFLRPLPFPDDDRIVMVYNSYPRSGMEFAGTSIPDYIDRRDQAESLQSLAILAAAQFTLGHDGEPEQLLALRASPSLFDVLGVSPQLGRTFTSDEAVPGNDRVVILGHDIWRTRFGQQAGIIGSDIHLDGESYRVVGVMPVGFAYPNREFRAWVPFSWNPEDEADDQRFNEFAASLGRLAPGATVDGLNAELRAIVARNAEWHPQTAQFIESSGFTGKARVLREFAVGELRPMVLVLQAIVLAVLLIACANIANLQLARMAARRKELSLRLALGAERVRLVRLVLTESLTLSAAGAIIGVAVATGGLELIRRLGLDRARQGFEFGLDPLVLVFTAGMAIIAGLIAGLLPVASLWRENPARVIQSGGRIGGGDSSARRFRQGLVVTQLAVSIALLIGAGLLAQGFHELQKEGPGFRTDSILTARVTLPDSRYPDDERRARFLEQAVAELAALPGVTSAAYTAVLPLSGNNWAGTFLIDGYDPPPGAPTMNANQRSVSHTYLPSLAIPLVHGRNFEAHETDRVAIVDQGIVDRYWPGQEPIGQRLRLTTDDPDTWFAVVGVAAPVKHASLTEGAQRETIYWHYLQRPMPFGMLTLSTAVPPEQVARQASQAILAIDAQLPIWDVRTFEARLYDNLGPQRAPMVLTLVLAAVAFTLAVVGIYGVLKWAVTQRYAEMGLRMALGARGIDIVKLIVGQGCKMIIVGVLAGLAMAVAIGRLVAAHFPHVSAIDLQIFAAGTLTLVVAALIASWLPARRAAGTAPMLALRRE